MFWCRIALHCGGSEGAIIASCWLLGCDRQARILESEAGRVGEGGRCKFSAKSGGIWWWSEIICLQCFSTLESSLEQSVLCPREYPSLLGFPREVSSWMTQRGGWPIFGSSACQTECHRSYCHTRVEDKRPNSADARNALPTDLAQNVRWLVVCLLFFLWQCSVE